MEQAWCAQVEARDSDISGQLGTSEVVLASIDLDTQLLEAQDLLRTKFSQGFEGCVTLLRNLELSEPKSLYLSASFAFKNKGLSP